jgi:hypothetical protein
MNSERKSFELSFDPDKVYDLDEISNAHDRTSNGELKVKVANSQDNTFNESITEIDGELALSISTEEKVKIKRADIRKYLFNNN